ncbi:MAG: hypothetical protein LBS31_12955, partial [Candidatus Adiutrix sp.]|jgi:hypothetical protein|nr:hypothetical protein [Candidatus Adiutrix sp.]
MNFLGRILASCLMIPALAALGLNGCALSGSGRAGHSFVASGYPAAAEAVVAEALAEELAGLFPPGHTAVYLKPAGSGSETLGQAIDQALRSRGFTVVPAPSGEALSVAYVLDRLDEETWYSRLSLSGGAVIARVYQAQGERFIPGAAARAMDGSGGAE